MRIFIAIVVLLAVAIAGALWWEDGNFAAQGPAESETIVLIKPGSSLSQIAQELEDSGVVGSALLFRAAVTRRGESAELKAGEYSFPAHASEADVLDMIVKHKSIQHKLTIPEGYTSGLAVAIVNNDPELEGPIVPEPPEGSLLPETYLFERGTTRAQLIARMAKARADLVAELWPTRQAGLPYKSPQDAIVMASLVEKETGVPAERGHVTRVFLNRIAQGMKLESDPTIIYGLTKGVPLGHPLRVSELQKPNPYSTYQIMGLPPGPICNPGRDAIVAALNPPPSNDLFFVANGTGGHAFAATLSEHQKHVAAWRQIEAAREAAVQAHDAADAAAEAAANAPAPLVQPMPHMEAPQLHLPPAATPAVHKPVVHKRRRRSH